MTNQIIRTVARAKLSWAPADPGALPLPPRSYTVLRVDNCGRVDKGYGPSQATVTATLGVLVVRLILRDERAHSVALTSPR